MLPKGRSAGPSPNKLSPDGTREKATPSEQLTESTRVPRTPASLPQPRACPHSPGPSKEAGRRGLGGDYRHSQVRVAAQMKWAGSPAPASRRAPLAEQGQQSWGGGAGTRQSLPHSQLLPHTWKLWGAQQEEPLV